MLKFIRLYGKWLLPIFVCFLAVAMLTTGYSSMQDGDLSGVPVGHLADGRKFTMADRKTAQFQLAILGARVHDPLLLNGAGGGREEESADRWMLLQAEADRLGVQAGGAEANTALYLLGFDKADAAGKRAGGLDEDAIAGFCAQHGTNKDGLLGAVRAYLRAEAVRQLLTGTAHDLPTGGSASLATPGLQRLALMAQLGRLVGMIPESRLAAMSSGAQRLSEPLLAHQLQNLGATVSGKLVVLPGATPGRLAGEAEPTDAQSEDLFAKGKDKDRADAPHGFGYRLPARIKAEGVRIPVAEGLRAAQAQVTEDDVREWFEKNPQAFVAKNEDGTPKAGETPLLTLENRKKSREFLLAQKSRELTLAFARTAAQALGGDARLAAAHNNQLPADAIPTPMTTAAEAVRTQHGFAPEVLTPAKIQAEATAAEAKLESDDGLPFLPVAGASEGWLTPQDLLFHPTLGGAAFARRPRHHAGSKEFAVLLENIEDPRGGLAASLARLDEHANLTPARVGAHLAETGEYKPRIAGITPALNLALPVVVAADGTCTVLRFTEAAAPRAAATLAEVRERVARDARTLAAYRNLVNHAATLVQNAAKADLEKFSSATDKLFAVPGLARTNPANPGRPPAIPGVGENEGLLKAVFDRAEALRTRPGGVKATPAEERLVAFADDRLCAMILFQIDDYAPIAKSQQLTHAKSPFQRFAVHNASGAPEEDPTDAAALKKRLGWLEK